MDFIVKHKYGLGMEDIFKMYLCPLDKCLNDIIKSKSCNIYPRKEMFTSSSN